MPQLEQLPYILEHFSIPQGPRKAQMMENTLRECERMPINGEKNTCVTSYELLGEFAGKIMGPETNIGVFLTQQPTRSTPDRLQNNTILQVPEMILTPKMTSCRTMAYP